MSIHLLVSNGGAEEQALAILSTMLSLRLKSASSSAAYVSELSYPKNEQFWCLRLSRKRRSPRQHLFTRGPWPMRPNKIVRLGRELSVRGTEGWGKRVSYSYSFPHVILAISSAADLVSN